MLSSRCPRCKSIQTRYLEDVSRDATDDYFLCDDCSHTWNVPKGETRPTNVTLQPVKATLRPDGAKSPPRN